MDEKCKMVSEDFAVTVLQQQIKLFELVARQYQERITDLERQLQELRQLFELRAQN